MTLARTGQMKNCTVCHQEMYVPRWRLSARFCSGTCRESLKKNDRRKFCVECNSSFLYRFKNKNTKFCSRECIWKHQRRGKLQYCRLCLSEMYVPVWNKSKIYCSRKCKDSDLANFQPRFNTAPERAVKRILRELHYGYRVNFPIEYNGKTKYYDIFIPSLNLLIEVDGIYWHGKGLKQIDMNPMQRKNRKNDILKNKIAKQSGYKLSRIWEDEISKEKVLCVLSQ